MKSIKEYRHINYQGQYAIALDNPSYIIWKFNPDNKEWEYVGKFVKDYSSFSAYKNKETGEIIDLSDEPTYETSANAYMALTGEEVRGVIKTGRGAEVYVCFEGGKEFRVGVFEFFGVDNVPEDLRPEKRVKPYFYKSFEKLDTNFSRRSPYYD